MSLRLDCNAPTFRAVQLLPDSFRLAPEPQATLDGLIRRLDDFAHLRQHTIGCLFSERALIDRGAQCRAVVGVPAQVTSKVHERQLLEWCYAQLFRPMLAGSVPDFVVFFDVAHWPRQPLQREQLVFHELMHIQQRLDEYGAPRFEKSGRPALHLVPHDIEVFRAELVRYGELVPAFDEAALAIAAAASRNRSAA